MWPYSCKGQMPLRILAITISYHSRGFMVLRKVWRCQREIRSRKSKKDRQYNVQTTTDQTRYQKGIRSRHSKKDWQNNEQNKHDNRTNNYLQKTKDWPTRPPLKTGGELMCSGRVGSSCYTSNTRRVNVNQTETRNQNKTKQKS
jgi:hypothetical protein